VNEAACLSVNQIIIKHCLSYKLSKTSLATFDAFLFADQADFAKVKQALKAVKLLEKASF